MLLIPFLSNLEVTSSFSFCLFLHCCGWQNHFFDGYWPIAFRVVSFAKYSFRLLPFMLLISQLTNLEISSFLRFCLFVYCFMVTKSLLWWSLTHRFGNSSICDGQFSLVCMYAPVFTISEFRSYSIVEVLSLSTLFHGGKIHSLMIADPSLLEFVHLQWSAFTRYHACSSFYC